MSLWICCNACFHQPSADRQLAVTTCGHIICNTCFRKGKQGECIICKAKCGVAALSDKSSSTEVKSLFMDISTVATKHFTEISKVLMFQARHSKKLLRHYQEGNQKLEEALVKMKQDMQQMNHEMQQMNHEMQQMSKKLNEKSAYISKLESALQQHQRYGRQDITTQAAVLPQQRDLGLSGAKSASSQINISSHSQNSVLQIPFNSPMPMGLLHSSTRSLRSEQMDVDGRSNPFRKPDPVPRLSRLSLISPPKDGRIGTVPQRSSSQNTQLSHAALSASVSRFQSMPNTPDISNGGRSGWNSPVYKPISAYKFSSMSNLVCPKR